MAVAAELLVVAADTGLLVVLGLDRMDADKIAAVVFRHVVALEGWCTQCRVHAAAGMTVITERLSMALNAVCTGLACLGTVFPHPVGILVVSACPIIVMGQGDSLLFVTGVTIFYLQFCVILMRHLLSTGLLLIAHQQPVDEQCTDEKNFLHKNPPFLKVVVEGNTAGPVVIKATDVNVVLYPCVKRHGLVEFVAGT